MLPLQQRFTDRKLIVRGDLAACYRARDARLERDVFLKVLHPALTADAEIRARFEREARAAARLDHPNLVRIHEFGEDPDEGFFMALEWVEGATLRELLNAGHQFSGDEILSIARQALAALAALHRVGILHRDLKPANILLGRDGRVRITDFSLAALQGAAQLTHHSAIVGTPAYMSPEQAAGRSPDARSELFALGIVLYELAAGKNPFASTEIMESLRRVRELEVDTAPLAELAEDLQSFVLACLQKEPEDRPASAAAGLELLGAGEGGDVHYPRARYEFRPWIIAGGLVVLVLIVMLGWPRVDKQPQTPLIASGTKFDSTAAGNQKPIESPDSSEETLASNITADSSQQPADSSISMEPEVSDKLPEETKRPTPVIISPASPLPDSITIMLTTEPWAHVSLDGRMLGTTPLADSVMLPAKEQVFTFVNTAFPPIQAELNPVSVNGRLQVNLLDYVMTLELSVEPWGEVYVDGEHRGTTPLSRPIYLLPGTHELRISHPALNTIAKELEANAGDTARVTVNLTEDELAVQYSKDSRP